MDQKVAEYIRNDEGKYWGAQKTSESQKIVIVYL